MDNKLVYNAAIAAFVAFYFALSIASCLALLGNYPIPAYYYAHYGDFIEFSVMPIYPVFFMNALATCILLFIFSKREHIVDIKIGQFNCNLYRWAFHFISDPSCTLVLFILHGASDLITIIMSYLLALTKTVLMFYYEEYLNPTYEFSPYVSPHSFALILQICITSLMILNLSANVPGGLSNRRAALSLLSIIPDYSAVLLQKIHIRFSRKDLSRRLQISAEEGQSYGLSDDDDDVESERARQKEPDAESDTYTDQVDENGPVNGQGLGQKRLIDRALESDFAEIQRHVIFEILRIFNSSITVCIITGIVCRISSQKLTLDTI